MDERFSDRMLLAEANQWPEDAAEYFGEGDECHMAFHFPLMPRLFMAIQMEDRFPIIDILQQTPEIPDGCQWALFLRNHDELTLEMVTDEERDYMYRVYAHEREARINLGIRRRLAPLLGNDRAKIELMNGLLLSLPGTPVIYYGDEIGMGDNIYLGDRDGVRTPMQWSGDRNAGFSRANPQRLYLPPIIDPEFHYETVNVETQAKNRGSLLWWMRRMLALRKRYQVFGRGTLEFLHPENRRVLAYLRSDGDQSVLIVANLSRFAQFVELDLSRFKGFEPVELFGQTHFPPIGELPYLLTLGPHAVYWLAIEGPREEVALAPADDETPAIAAQGSIDAIVGGRGRAELERAIARFLPTRRWFSGKARRIRSVTVTDSLPLAGPRAGLPARVLIARVEFNEGEAETYAMPLVLLEGERAERLAADAPRSVVARMERRGEPAVIAEALFDPEVCRALLDAVRHRRRLRGSEGGSLAGRPSPALRDVLDGEEPPEPSIFRAEQSNTSVLFGQSLILKLFRRVEDGVNPDLELGRYLAERTAFAHTPRVAGALEYQKDGGEPATLAILHEFVPNEGDAWQYTLDALGRFYEQAVTERIRPGAQPPEPAVEGLLERAAGEIPDEVDEVVGSYLQSAQLMGRRLAELHAALAGDGADPALAAEPITPHYQRSVYQSARNLTGRTMQLLRRALPSLGERERAEAEDLLARDGRHPAALLGPDRPPRPGRPHPGARRPPPGPGALHRPRLPDHRLRGRARPVADRAPREAHAAARRRRPAAVLRLRDGHGAARRRRPGPGRRRLGRRPRAGGLGPPLERVGLGRVPRLLPRGRRRRALDPGRPRRPRPGARHRPPGEGHLRARLRAQQPPRLGARPAARDPRPARRGRLAAARAPPGPQGAGNHSRGEGKRWRSASRFSARRACTKRSAMASSRRVERAGRGCGVRREAVPARPELVEQPDAAAGLERLAQHLARGAGDGRRPPQALQLDRAEGARGRVVREDARQEQRQVPEPPVDGGVARLGQHVERRREAHRVELAEALAPPSARSLPPEGPARDAGVRGQQRRQEGPSPAVVEQLAQVVAAQERQPLPRPHPLRDVGGLAQVGGDLLDGDREGQERRRRDERLALEVPGAGAQQLVGGGGRGEGPLEEVRLAAQ